MDTYSHALSQLKAYNLVIENDRLITDGQAHRCYIRGDKKGSKNGWYQASEISLQNGQQVICGGFGSWKDQGDWKRIEWQQNGTPFSQSDRKELMKKQDEAMGKIEVESKKRSEEAMIKTQVRWDNAQLNGTSPYLENKKVRSYGVRFEGNDVLVPLYRGSKIVGIQTIKPDGSKRFNSGATKKWAYFIIGNPEPESPLAIAEGYSTAATIHEITGWPVVVAFDAGNLLPVANTINLKYPESKLIICADDDHKTKGNPGITNANKAASAVNAIVAIPKFPSEKRGTDWNDLFCLEGADEAKKQLDDSLQNGLRVGNIVYAEIEITTKEHEVNEQTEKTLSEYANTKHAIFSRGASLVQVMPANSTGPLTRPEGAQEIRELPPSILSETLSKIIKWKKYDKRNDEYVDARPPPWVTRAMGERGYWENMPELTMTADYPVVLEGGKILSEAGYDPASGIFLRKTLKLSIPDNPTQEDAQRCAKYILDTFVDFPIKSREHIAALLAMILTPLARPAIDGPVPLFLVDGNIRGLGKGLLSNCVNLLITGKDITIMSAVSDGEELRKRLFSILLAGDTIILFDNAKSLGGSTMDAMLTSKTWKDRILGASKTVTLPNVTTYFATGNNITIHGDTARRIVNIRLESLLSQPEHRDDFTIPDIRSHILDNRKRLLEACFTILRAWHLVKENHDLKIKPCGSFEAWATIVQGACVFASVGDPVETQMELAAESDSDVQLRELLIAGFGELDKQPEIDIKRGAMAREIIQTFRAVGAEALPSLDEAFSAIFGSSEPTTQKLGSVLNSMRRQVFGGKYLDNIKNSGVSGVKKWVLVDVTQ